jgi:hypothetical protein
MVRIGAFAAGSSLSHVIFWGDCGLIIPLYAPDAPPSYRRVTRNRQSNTCLRLPLQLDHSYPIDLYPSRSGEGFADPLGAFVRLGPCSLDGGGGLALALPSDEAEALELTEGDPDPRMADPGHEGRWQTASWDASLPPAEAAKRASQAIGWTADGQDT